MTENASLQSRIRLSPRSFDDAAGARVLASAPSLSGEARELVRAVAGCSPFLARLMVKAGDALPAYFERAPEAMIAEAVRDAWRAADEVDIGAQQKSLRLAKSKAALSTALAEISGACSTMQAAADYSRFADAVVGSALRMALRQTERLGFIPVDHAQPEAASGVVALAMGKMGAFELNFSSDIDLIVLFDADNPSLAESGEAKRIAVAAAKAMVSRLNDQTADGYVFRTDLRLRPDPGVSAAAVSVNAAEAYYESFGQNWERAAFIKARAAAGDIALGEDFIARLRPFIWRKYLDYAAIDEIQGIMRQIHESGGGTDVEFRGHDLKKGRGGIRQIEFLAQTQQLILGGKDAGLRLRPTLEVLSALAERSIITPAARAMLDENYTYLRCVEHRIQMTADEQTHRVPSSDDEIRRLACFLGEESPDAFESRLHGVLQATDRQAAETFEPRVVTPASVGPFNFSGVDLDPDTGATLERLGFQRPRQVAETVQRWHAGEMRATRSARARALLAEFTPQLLEALSRAKAPDDALSAFDAFIRQLPAGVQIFSLFLNRPDIFGRLILIMTVSPFLGRELARHAHLLEALIEARWPAPEPTTQTLAEALSRSMSAAKGFEEILNAARRWASEENFSVAAQLVTGLIGAESAAKRFTMIAEAAIGALMPAAEMEMKNRFGEIDGEIAVIALGRLGAEQMTAASDVDIMFVYDAGEDVHSTGQGSLDATTYFARLVRRFLTAMTSQTEEGALYEVDMQLRPSGGKGPAAVSYSAFHHYYEDSAWTWELMAMTKARAIAGAAAIRQRVDEEISNIIRRPRDAAVIARDVDEMRERLRDAKPAASVWDVKHSIGGSTEVDFVIQYLTLVHAHSSILPIGVSGETSLSALRRAGAIAEDDAKELNEALRIYETVAQLSRASTGGVFSAEDAGQSLKDLMTEALTAPSLEEAETILADKMDVVRRIYERIVKTAAKGSTA